MRLLLATVTFISVLFAPLWVVLIGSGLLSIRYRASEVVLIGFLIDMIYLPSAGFFGFSFVATLIAVIVVWGFEPLRSQLIFR